MTKTNGVHSITPDLLKALVPTLSRAKRDQYAQIGRAHV